MFALRVKIFLYISYIYKGCPAGKKKEKILSLKRSEVFKKTSFF